MRDSKEPEKRGESVRGRKRRKQVHRKRERSLEKEEQGKKKTRQGGRRREREKERDVTGNTKQRESKGYSIDYRQ